LYFRKGTIEKKRKGKGKRKTRKKLLVARSYQITGVGKN